MFDGDPVLWTCPGIQPNRLRQGRFGRQGWFGNAGRVPARTAALSTEIIERGRIVVIAGPAFFGRPAAVTAGVDHCTTARTVGTTGLVIFTTAAAIFTDVAQVSAAIGPVIDGGCAEVLSLEGAVRR